MTGNTIVLALLAVLVVLGGTTYLLSQLLPEAHPVRKSVEATKTWIKDNPDLFLKRLQQTAAALIILTFAIITLVYS